MLKEEDSGELLEEVKKVESQEEETLPVGHKNEPEVKRPKKCLPNPWNFEGFRPSLPFPLNPQAKSIKASKLRGI